MQEVENTIANKVFTVIVAPLVTAFTAWLVPFIERNVPGTPDLDDAQVAALAVAGALAGFGLAVKYLHELAVWQKLTKFGASK